MCRGQLRIQKLLFLCHLSSMNVFHNLVKLQSHVLKIHTGRYNSSLYG